MYPGAVVSEYHLQMPRQYEGLSKLSRKEMNEKSSFIHFLRQPEHPILGSESARRSEFHATKGGSHLSKYELDLLLYAHNRDEHARQLEEKRRLRELVESKRALKAEQKLQNLNVPLYRDGTNGDYHSLAETSVRNWAKAYAPADLQRYDACVQLARKAEIEEKMIKKAQALYETEQNHIATLLSSNHNFETRKRDQTVEAAMLRSQKAATKAKKIELAESRRNQQLQQSHDATVSQLERQEASVERVLEIRDEQRRQRGREKLAELDRREQQVRAAAEAFENRRYVKRRASLTLTQKETKRARRVNKKLINEIAVETHNDIEFRSQRAYKCWEKSWELRDKKRHDIIKRRDEMDTRFSNVRAEQDHEWKERTGFKRKRWKSKQQYVGQLQASQAQQRSDRLKAVLKQVESAQQRKEEVLRTKLESTKNRSHSSGDDERRPDIAQEVSFVGELGSTKTSGHKPSPPLGAPPVSISPSPKAQQARGRQAKHAPTTETLPSLKSTVTSGTFSLTELQAEPSGSKAPSPPESPPPVSGRSQLAYQSQPSESQATANAQGRVSPRRGPPALTLPTGPKSEVDESWINERLKVMDEKQRAAEKRHAEVLKRVQLTAGKELTRVDKKREDHEQVEMARQKELREMVKAKADSPRVRPIEFRESLTARGPRRYENEAELFQSIPFCNSARLGTLRSPRPLSETGLQQRLASTMEAAHVREERADKARQRREEQIAAISQERNLHLQQHIRKHEDLSSRLERRAHMSKIRHQHESSDPHIAFLAMRETLREENLEKSKKERQKREEAAELRHQQHLSEIEEKARRTIRQPVPPSRSPRSEDEFYAKEEQRRNRYVIDVNA